MNEQNILFVEDDKTLAFLTMDSLAKDGYIFHHYDNGQSAKEAIEAQEFDLAIFDVMLPEVDGFTLAKLLRQRDVNIPILFLTAKSLKEDRLSGFALGADDYLSKPFSIEELKFKIEIFLKRRNVVNNVGRKIYQIGSLVLNVPHLTLTSDEISKKLTHREAEILELLAKNKGNVVSREQILEMIWGKNDYFHGRSLDVFISRLRKYLRADEHVEISNIHGIGFKLLEK